MRIYLTGFMGAGKTTVGRILADRLGVPFVDLDDEIIRAAGMPIQRIFEQHGEEWFRNLESECLTAIELNPCVVATGGGAFIYMKEWMLKNGLVIYLKVPLEEIVRRIGTETDRPLWRDGEAMYASRMPHYSSAHVTIEANAPPENTVSRIIEYLSGAEFHKTRDN